MSGSMKQTSEGVSPNSDAHKIHVASGTVRALYRGFGSPTQRSVITVAFYEDEMTYRACVLNDKGALVYAESLEDFMCVEG